MGTHLRRFDPDHRRTLSPRAPPTCVQSRGGPVDLRHARLILAGGTIAAVFGILYSARSVFAPPRWTSSTPWRRHRAHLDVRLAIAGVLLYVAATQWWTGETRGSWTEALATPRRPSDHARPSPAPRSSCSGWLANVTIWFLRAGSRVITFILLAALVMRAAADRRATPAPAPARIRRAGALDRRHVHRAQHTSEFLGERGGDRVDRAASVAGVVVVVIGAGIRSAEAPAR